MIKCCSSLSEARLYREINPVPAGSVQESVCLALLAADPVLGSIRKVFCYREPVNFWAQTIVPICHTLQHK